MTERETTLTEYADYICPFCYLAHHSLERYRRTEDESLAVEWHPYDLRSEERGSDGTIDEADMGYPAAVAERIERLQTEYGADEMLGFDTVPKVDSLHAQMASLYVKGEHPEQWAAFDAGLFDALWQEGRDISDGAELAEIAASVGVAGDKIHDAIADDERRERLFERFAEARRDAVTDVPTFVANGRTTTGVLPPKEIDEFVRDR